MSETKSKIELAIEARLGECLALPDEIPNEEAFLHLNERSVCRDYKETSIPKELLNLLLQTALSAPSKSDLQQASIVRISCPTRRQRIYDLMPTSTWVRHAPEFLVFCADHSRLARSFELRNKTFPNQHLDTFFNASVDAGIQLSLFIQAATLVGLGTCPISEIRDSLEEIKEILELPRYVVPVCGLTLGYANSFEPLSPRLSPEATLHENTYASSKIEPSLSEYDRRRNKTRPYSAQRDTETFGVATEYGWSEDKFRQYSKIQRDTFGEFVTSCGFKLK